MSPTTAAVKVRGTTGRRALAPLLALLLVACGGGTGPISSATEPLTATIPPTMKPTAPPASTCSSSPTMKPTAPPASTCSSSPTTYAELVACDGPFEEISAEVASSFEGKTLARIAIASPEPLDILGGMAAAVREWAPTADSLTVFAFSAAGDYAAGSPYNRGRIFWNNGGPITVNICTSFSDLGDGIDFCDEEDEYIVANR